MPPTGLYPNEDQRRIGTKNQIRTKNKFGPKQIVQNFETRPNFFR